MAIFLPKGELMRAKLYLEYLLNTAADAYPDGGKSFHKMDLSSRVKILHDNVARGLSYTMMTPESDINDTFGPSHVVGFLSQYIEGKAKVYRIADKFGSHLNRTKLKLPTSILPYSENQYYMFEFPECFHDESTGDYHRNVIVHLGTEVLLDLPGVDKPMILGLKDCKRGMVFIFPDYDKNGNTKDTQTFLRLDPTVDVTIEKIMDRHINDMLNSNVHLKRIVGFALKCLLYVSSGDPDLKDESCKKILTENPKKIRRHIKNECMIDAVSVGYGMHKRHFKSSESEVVGHYRWQPYGPGRTQVKLIWIDEHIRKYGEDQ